MPTRLIREGWLESESVNLLTGDEERFYLRLMLRADDYGRYHANPILLRSALYPLKDDVRTTDVSRWLAACEKAGLVRCYTHAHKPYLEIFKFGQRTRADTSKFPEPPAQADTAQLPGISLTDAARRPAPARHLPDTRPSTDGPPRTYADSKAKPRIQAPPAPPSSRASEAPPLFQSIADVCGIATSELGPRARKGLESALREITAATPTVTPEQIAARAAAYRKAMPAGCRLTPHALAKHWASLTVEAPPVPVAEPAGWRETLAHLFPGNAISGNPGRDWASLDSATQAKVLAHRKHEAA